MSQFVAMSPSHLTSHVLNVVDFETPETSTSSHWFLGTWVATYHVLDYEEDPRCKAEGA